MSVAAVRVAAFLAFAILAIACSGGQPGSSARHDPAPGTEPAPDFARAGWKTDFTKHSVALSEIRSGGPPRDGIPPLDHPKFVPPSAAASWLKGQEPVISLALEGDHRAYPIQILIWHEIVNDQVGGTPVTVSFCPLCNTSKHLHRLRPPPRRPDPGLRHQRQFAQFRPGHVGPPDRVLVAADHR